MLFTLSGWIALFLTVQVNLDVFTHSMGTENLYLFTVYAYLYCYSIIVTVLIG